MDPYKVLGVLPESSTSQIKDAYSKILDTYNVKKTEDADNLSLFEEKIQEANEAFRILTNDIACEEVRDLIDKDDFVLAESKLNLVSDYSSAEWNYLKGVLLLKKGWVDSGMNHIEKAANLNPYNLEYINTINKLKEKVKKGRSAYSTTKKSGGLSICNSNNKKQSNLC